MLLPICPLFYLVCSSSQGSVHHRLLPSNVLTERGVKRQFQHPAFANKGKYVAFAEMHFKETGKLLSKH